MKWGDMIKIRTFWLTDWKLNKEKGEIEKRNWKKCGRNSSDIILSKCKLSSP